MNPRVSKVSANQDYTLQIRFENGEQKLFDVKPYLEIGNFCELKDMSVFNSVKEFLGSIQWKNGLDLCPDMLYEEGILI